MSDTLIGILLMGAVFLYALFITRMLLNNSYKIVKEYNWIKKEIIEYSSYSAYQSDCNFLIFYYFKDNQLKHLILNKDDCRKGDKKIIEKYEREVVKQNRLKKQKTEIETKYIVYLI